MGTIANAKVTHYYNCYNGDFIGCLPLSDVYRLSASYAKKTPEARMPRESYFNRIGLYKII